MNLRFLYIILFFSVLIPYSSFSQGLKFKGNECPIDERTSYTVFSDEPLTFTDCFSIGFDISILEPSYIGYIIRIKDENTHTTYNMSLDSQGTDIIFKFNEEGRSSLITARLNKGKYQSCQWFRVEMLFDLEKDSLTLGFNEERFKIGNLKLPGKLTPFVFMGKSEHVIDVPSFAVKDLVIKDNKQEYVFSLKEDKGNEVRNAKGKVMGYVSNPVWLINNAYYWAHKTSFKSDKVAGVNFNPADEEIYFYDRDSISVYNIRTGSKFSRAFANKCPMNFALGTNFVDYNNKRLYAYEVYTESEESVTIASLDLHDYTWTAASKESLPRQLHHHGTYFDQTNMKYTVFGGFGNMHYNKNFYTYNLQSDKWDTLSYEGDVISPRYFLSMGYLGDKNSLYVFGGMGNESGDQIVGRRYFYDLHEFNLNTRQVKKLWEIPWDNDNVVPVRGMVILNDSCFYTLCYPEHFSNSYLRLYRFSLRDGSYEVLGDSIPIHSERINTNANLYYDSKLNELYAIVQEFDDDIASDVKVYSLAFPPVTVDELSSFIKSGTNDNMLYWIIATILFLFSGIIILVFAKRKKGKEDRIFPPLSDQTAQTISLVPEISKRVDKPNSIYLFGEFTTRDKHNKDISYMFSTKLKQAFLVILQYSLEDGISSQRLSDLLWPDKPESKVKNSRGVTINHLRKVLDEFDGIKLVYEKGLFRIVCNQECYCDCLRCVDIISSGNIDQNSVELTEILTRGKFLKSTDMPLLDSFKEAIEQKIEPVLLVEMERSYTSESYPATVSFAEAMFHIDPLNEDAIRYIIHALQKLKLNDEAKKRYLFFTSEYRKMMGNEYRYSFSDLSSNK